jgi:hemoglobin
MFCRSLILMSLILAGNFAIAAKSTKSLYDRLGGEEAISKVVDAFVGKAAGDPAVDFFRGDDHKDMDVAKFKMHLVQFLSKAFGAKGVKYEGRDMKTAHAGMKITEEQFNALAGDLQAALKEAGVPSKETGDVMKIAASTKKDIVGR